MLVYTWAIGIDGAVHEYEVEMRADNASIRGVPLPEHWRTAIRCRDLANRAAEAARVVEAWKAMADVDCAVVGVLKPQLLRDADTVVGDIVGLRTPAGRMQFVLCAHVSGDEWYCHAGSFGAEGLTAVSYTHLTLPTTPYV